jgi:hypothetical protein
MITERSLRSQYNKYRRIILLSTHVTMYLKPICRSNYSYQATGSAIGPLSGARHTDMISIGGYSKL